MISSSVLQSMMAINAQSIKQHQIYAKHLKSCAVEHPEYASEYYSHDIRKAKHLMGILERNQRAMKQELMAVYEEENFQRAVKLLTEDMIDSLDDFFED